jgi:excisionase family DNA binding protein
MTSHGHNLGTAAMKPLDNPVPEKRPVDRQSVGPRPGQRLLTLREAACYLGLSQWTLRELYWKGRVPGVRMTRKIHFDLRDLDSFIEASKEKL